MLRQPQFAARQAGVPVPKNHSRVLTDRNTAQRRLRSLEHVLGIGTKEVKSGFLRPIQVSCSAGLACASACSISARTPSKSSSA
jgi:hypothetical protein